MIFTVAERPLPLLFRGELSRCTLPTALPVLQLLTYRGEFVVHLPDGRSSARMHLSHATADLAVELARVRSAAARRPSTWLGRLLSLHWLALFTGAVLGALYQKFVHRR